MITPPLGFTVTADGRPHGRSSPRATTQAPGSIALEGASPPPAGHTGSHFALVFPGPAEFATAWRDSVRAVIRSISRGTTGATVSVCLHDPGGNGIELYFDRSRHLWFDGQGRAVLEAEHIAARG